MNCKSWIASMRLVKKSNYRESLQSPRRRVTSVDASGPQRVYVTRHVTYLRRSHEHRGRSSRTIITSGIDEKTNLLAVVRTSTMGVPTNVIAKWSQRDHTGMILERLHVCLSTDSRFNRKLGTKAILWMSSVKDPSGNIQIMKIQNRKIN